MSGIVLLLHLVKMYFEQRHVEDTQIQLQANLVAKQNNMCDNIIAVKQNAYGNLKMNKLTPKYILFCFRKNVLIKKCMRIYNIFLTKQQISKDNPHVIYTNTSFVVMLSSHLLLFFCSFSSWMLSKCCTPCSLRLGPVQLIYMCSFSVMSAVNIISSYYSAS